MSSASTSGPSPAAFPKVWEFPQNIAGLFPKSEADRLTGEGNYHVWAICMMNGFEITNLHGIIDGSLTHSSPGDTNEAMWTNMNVSARTIIIQCVNSDLVMKVSHLHAAKDVWDIFASEYSQAGTGSSVYWFSRLHADMQSGDDVVKHISSFQEAY